MNKLFGYGADGNVLVCILEPGNLHRLQKNEPIEIDLNDGPWRRGLPAKVKVVIAFSETPIADAKKFLQDFPDMAIDDQRTPVTESKRPHCPECRSTVEQLGVWRSDQAPLWLAFCATCGCIFGPTKPVEELRRTPKLLESK